MYVWNTQIQVQYLYQYQQNKEILEFIFTKSVAPIFCQIYVSYDFGLGAPAVHWVLRLSSLAPFIAEGTPSRRHSAPSVGPPVSQTGHDLQFSIQMDGL